MNHMRAVTFKQAHRELRMEVENLEWDEQPVNPNSYTVLSYYQERISVGAENNVAYWTNILLT